MDYLGGSTVITRVLINERWRQKSLREDVMVETEGKMMQFLALIVE